MPDENKNGIDDLIEAEVYKKHAGRKFLLTIGASSVFFVFAGLCFFRGALKEMCEVLQCVIWTVGLYCGANVAQDFTERKK